MTIHEDKSIATPPSLSGGMLRRSGASTGSVRPYNTDLTGATGESGAIGIHDMMNRPKRTSRYSVVSMHKMVCMDMWNPIRVTVVGRRQGNAAQLDQ